jgi:hypothetical protein
MVNELAISKPACPRCGYQLIGAVEMWREHCPLDGRCSECGLEFNWRDVLNPRFHAPRWCIEYGTAAAAPVRMFRTLLMMLRPWRFWSELQMSHEPRWRRLAVFTLAPAALLYVVFAFAVGWGTNRWYADLRASGGGPSPGPRVLMSLRAVALPFERIQSRSWSEIPHDIALRYRRTPVESIRRAFAYGAEPGFPRDSLTIISERAGIALVLVILCPAGMALLPISRRRAHVRWRHVARIGVYALVLAVIPLAADIWCQVCGTHGARRGHIALGFTLLTGLALWAWWALASGRYLHMPHAWAIGLYVVVFAFVLQRLLLESVSALLAIV